MHVPQFCTMAASSAKEKTPYLSILAVYMRPFSRGRVVSERMFIASDISSSDPQPYVLLPQHASSADPSSPPTIDPGYFSNKADLQVMAQAVRFARKVVQTEPLASLVVAPTDPSPETLDDDAELEKYIKTTLETAHHPTGTAAMMPRNMGGAWSMLSNAPTMNSTHEIPNAPSKGVAGPDLRVYGCANLRIADASIIPIQLSAHPQVCTSL